MSIKFYEKIGNSSFAPTIKANSILLDNQSVSSAIPGEENTITQYNGVMLDFSVSSKQDLLDNWISDLEYLSYSEITFVVVQDIQDAEILSDNMRSVVLTSDIANAINSITGSVKYETIKLAEFVNLEQTSERSLGFLSTLQINFNELDTKKDIILFVIPSIDFMSYFVDNNLEQSTEDTIRLIKSIYTSEFERYNILIKNKVIDSGDIVNDVRDIKQLRTTLTNLQPALRPDTNADTNSLFLSSVYTSFDYENSLIRNYVFFNISNFLKQKSVYNNLFTSFTKKELTNIFLQNKSITFTINKIFADLAEKQVCIFNAAYDKITGTKNAQLIPELTSEDYICFSFSDDVTQISNQSFRYQINISYKDPFTKNFYDTTLTPSSGVYFDVLANLGKIESFVNDPRNTDTRTARFNKAAVEAPERELRNLVHGLFKMFNAVSAKPIVKEKIDKIYKSLSYKNSTYQIHFDFIQYVKSLLPTFESIFTNQKLQTTQLSKNSDKIFYKNNEFYFKFNDFDSSKLSPMLTTELKSVTDEISVKYFVESNNNSLREYDLESSQIDSSNPVTFKIINSSVVLGNDNIGYSPDYDLSSNFFESQGGTIKTITALSSKKSDVATSLFSKTSVNIDNFQKPASVTLDSKKEIKKSLDQIGSKKITNIVDTSKSAKKSDTQTTFLFQTTFLNDINKEFLIPKINIQLYDPITNEWRSADNLQNNGKTYLARTNYIQKNNIFYSNKVAPPIINEYFVLKLK